MTNALHTLPAEVAQDRVLNFRELSAFLSVPVPSLRRMHREKRGPKMIQLSERRLGCRVRDAIAWLESRATQEAA